MAVEVPYHHPVFTVWLKNVKIDCFVGWTVVDTDGQVSVWENELHGDVLHVSFLWSLDLCGWYAGFDKCRHSTFGSVCSINQCISYPPMENLWVLLRWVSWMQQTFFSVLRNCWSTTPSAFRCTMWSVWWQVTLLCPPPAIRRGSEPQSVALVGPFWGWGLGAVPSWLRPTRTTPQQSTDNCTAMFSLIQRQLILNPHQLGCHLILAVEVFAQHGLLPKDSCFTELTSPSYLDLWSAFPLHRWFVFQNLQTPSAQLLWHAAGCCPLPLHSCCELQVLLFHLICHWGQTIWP